jgi:hypothetical protein
MKIVQNLIITMANLRRYVTHLAELEANRHTVKIVSVRYRIFERESDSVYRRDSLYRCDSP